MVVFAKISGAKKLKISGQGSKNNLGAASGAVNARNYKQMAILL